MRPLLLVLGIALYTSNVNAEDLSKATRGLLLSTDCDEQVCASYAIEVSQKFVRLPIKKQAKIVTDFCHKLDEQADVQSCIFRYHGEDIGYETTTGRVEFEAWYISALAALRDPR